MQIFPPILYSFEQNIDSFVLYFYSNNQCDQPSLIRFILDIIDGEKRICGIF